MSTESARNFSIFCSILQIVGFLGWILFLQIADLRPNPIYHAVDLVVILGGVAAPVKYIAVPEMLRLKSLHLVAALAGTLSAIVGVVLW